MAGPHRPYGDRNSFRAGACSRRYRKQRARRPCHRQPAIPAAARMGWRRWQRGVGRAVGGGHARLMAFTGPVTAHSAAP